MTRIAPTLTLLTVAALGGGMFLANRSVEPEAPSVSAPAAVIDAAGPGGGNTDLALALGNPSGVTEIDLAEVPVAGGGPGGDAAVAPGRTEISLADIPVVEPGSAAPAAGDPADAPAAAGESAGTDAFVGETDGGELTVAIAVRGDEAVAYVCNGGSIEAWLSGSASGEELSLTSRSGRSSLSGTGTSGTVTVDGKDFSYTARATDVASAAKTGRKDVGSVVSRLDQAG